MAKNHLLPPGLQHRQDYTLSADESSGKFSSFFDFLFSLVL